MIKVGYRHHVFWATRSIPDGDHAIAFRVLEFLQFDVYFQTNKISSTTCLMFRRDSFQDVSVAASMLFGRLVASAYRAHGLLECDVPSEFELIRDEVEELWAQHENRLPRASVLGDAVDSRR